MNGVEIEHFINDKQIYKIATNILILIGKLAFATYSVPECKI